MIASKVRSFCAIGFGCNINRKLKEDGSVTVTVKFEPQIARWPPPLTITASNLSSGMNSSMYDLLDIYIRCI